MNGAAPAPRHFYLGDEGQAVLATFHPAADAGTSTSAPVLFVPPWGWDEVASFRVRRDWAVRLAAAGHPTLRFALAATGNSAGSPRDPGLLAAWIASVGAAATWLAEETGADTVTALGLGLGGLLALAAAAAGAPLDGVAAWGAPKAGSAFARETRAFSRLNRLPPSDPPLPEGWMEAGGFLLSAETIEELRGLPTWTEGAPRRALLLGRDGVGPAAELEEGLRGAGAEVAVDPGVGWSQMTEHPETAVLPVASVEVFERWLGEGAAAEPTQAGPGARADGDPVRTAPQLSIALDGGGVREEPIVFGQEWGDAFGIWSGPADRPAVGPVVVFMNAGAVHSSGPNRMWTETARELAARGIASLRIDLQGIGEADGEPGGVLQLGMFNQPRFAEQLRSVIEGLSDRARSGGFLLAGLCAGAHTAFRVAEEERVVEAILVNGSALRWDDSLPTAREARKVSRTLDRRWLRKLLGGEIGPRRVLAVVGSFLVQRVRDLRAAVVRRRGAEVPLEKLVEADLDHLAASGTRLILAFSGDELLDAELRANGLAEKIAAEPTFGFRSLPGSDHTLRPVSTQRKLRELILDEAAGAGGL